ncbi:MAG: exopolyphosphatase/guanosine-5'-triphosphate,3'-diphosphate pyrophosphatase [Saprospiraceae bacterium]|jgi:exopolyphosphatase/guanosine-5'-triphosphate,3'-diphosphate pyrophosphatase|tara:strand:+ start:769 stop:1674 length:906 start_codon:yes stop_codon:yes gene_type:complete
MAIHKFGAIDVGSNAVRLLISSIIEDGDNVYFKKISLVRLPLRLGLDAFTQHKLSDEKIEQVMHTMHAYSHLMKAHDVIAYRACATSAMREAKNGKAITRRILKETGINLEIIEGKEEAEILYATQIAGQLTPNRPYLYIDVGGGSTEISVFYDGAIHASKSFKIGTIRLLNKMVKKEVWNEMETWVKSETQNFQGLSSIGTGGNISKIFKMNGLPKGQPLPFVNIVHLYDEIKDISYEDRIRHYDMRPDRADVIIPASDIYMRVMTWAKSPQIYVPKVGVADGIVRMLYKEFKEKQGFTL